MIDCLYKVCMSLYSLPWTPTRMTLLSDDHRTPRPLDMASNTIHIEASFVTLPSDILTHIALASILYSQEIPSPEDLTTLLALVFTCRAIHGVLSLTSNPDLYGTIFRLMFDTTAIKRRLGSAAVVSSVLARELPMRVRMLTHIKAALATGYWERAKHRNDWNLHGNCYIRKVLAMMSENEEKNTYQLAVAGISKVSDALVTQLLRFGLDATPPSHQPCMTLTFALMWMLSSQG